jgi:hypothetical protein
MEGRAGWEVVTRLNDFTKATRAMRFIAVRRYTIARIDPKMLQPFGTSILRAPFKYRMHAGDIEWRDCFR